MARLVAAAAAAALTVAAAAGPAADEPRLVFDEVLPASLAATAVTSDSPLLEGGYDSELCVAPAVAHRTLRLLPLEKRFFRRAGAVWSPDGTRLAYTGLTGGLDTRVVIRDLVHGTVRDVQTSQDAAEPAWSPDGTRLAFVVTGPKPFDVANARIAVSDADGGAVRILTDGFSPTWSPDSSRIAFATAGFSRPHFGQLGLVPSAGGTPTFVTADAAVSGGPRNVPTSWSPDGWLTFTSQTDDRGNSDVQLIRADGSGRHTLLMDARDAAWSPDGTHVAFVRGHDVYVAAADGSGAVPVTSSPPRKDHPAWPPAPVAPAAGAGACDVTGTSGPDVLLGTRAREVLYGLAGNDRIDGRGGGDLVFAGAGADRVRGATRVDAGTGNDTVIGTPGGDDLRGGPGNDLLVGGAGADYVDAGPGNDRVLVRDGRRDVVDCGAGVDTVVADRVDRLAHCEHVSRR